MILWLKRFLFGPDVKSPVQILLESEVAHLREQNKFLLETIQGFQAPKLRVSNPDDFRPKKFDPTTKRYVAKTDEEIEADVQGMKELGIV